jgi:hypothetical protein
VASVDLSGGFAAGALCKAAASIAMAATTTLAQTRGTFVVMRKTS